jgi:hypothetical protein
MAEDYYKVEVMVTAPSGIKPNEEKLHKGIADAFGGEITIMSGSAVSLGPVPDARSTLWQRRAHTWTDEELEQERAHYQAKIDAATGWGAAVGEYNKRVQVCLKEQRIRKLQGA